MQLLHVPFILGSVHRIEHVLYQGQQHLIIIVINLHALKRLHKVLYQDQGFSYFFDYFI